MACGIRETTEKFILRSKEIHGDKYDYSKVKYINNYTYVTIICSIHGEFFQTPATHLRGCNCPECTKPKLNGPIFIRRSNVIHNNKYDYSKMVYVNSTTKITIICPIHGEFKLKPTVHLEGDGCQTCGVLGSIEKRKDNNEKFEIKANIIHNNKYDYSKMVYLNSLTKITIICPIHGDFEQIPSNHLRGHGCKKCGDIIIGDKLRLTNDEFLEQSIEVHGDKYDYSKSQYITMLKSVEIICKKHNKSFKITPYDHMKGIGCPKCTKQLNTSYPEQAIFYYIKQLFPNSENPYKIGKKSIDIYIPEINLGIEYDGVYYHKDKEDNDILKTKLAKEQDIDLIRVREKGLLGIDDCLNIFLEKNNDDISLEKVINQIFDYIQINYNFNKNFDINLKKDKYNILSFIKFNEIKDSIVTTHPEIVKQLHPTKNIDLKPEYFTYGSDVKLWWICENNHEWERKIHKNIKNNNICLECLSDTKSNDLINKLKLRKDNKYDYSKTKHISVDLPVILICKEHGEFSNTPYRLLQMKRTLCPKCRYQKK